LGPSESKKDINEDYELIDVCGQLKIVAYFFHFSTSRQQTCNWIGQSLSCIAIPWVNKNLSKDSERVMLKKCFYPKK